MPIGLGGLVLKHPLEPLVTVFFLIQFCKLRAFIR